MSNTELLLRERQALIRKRLLADGRVIAAQLAAELTISEDTIRRDLREMAAAGLCRRVYGGALPPAAEESGLLERLSQKPERKDAIARATVTLFKPGMVLMIDAGTTNLAIAQAIAADLRLTVITNAPTIAAALLDRPEIDVVMIGGQLDHRSGAVIGAGAIRDAGQFHPDLCVLGSCGLDPEMGVGADVFEEAEFKRFIALRSKAVVAAVTNEKLGLACGFSVVALDRCSHLVLEHDAEEGQVSALARAGCHIIQAQAP